MASPTKKRLRKAVLTLVKVAVVAVLLGWVFSQSHWNDYVKAADDGKTYSVVAAQPDRVNPQTLTISKGLLWWRTVEPNHPVGEFKPPQEGASIFQPGVRTAFSNVNPWLLLVSLAGYVVSLAIIGARWWMLMGIQNIRIGLWETERLAFLGQFFNAVVPAGTAGGDLVKAYYAAKHTPKKAAALVSVFVDRVTGFAELVLLAGAMLLAVRLTGAATFEQIRRAGLFVICFGCGIAGALVFLLSPRFRRAFHLEKLWKRLPIAHHIAAAGDAADLYRRRLGTLAKALLLTFGAQAIWMCSIGLLGVALGLDLPFYTYLLYVPVIYMVGAFIPTPGGVGGVEGAYVFFFAAYPQVGVSQILALALLARLWDIARGLPGAVIAIAGPRRPKAAEMEAELGIGADSAE